MNKLGWVLLFLLLRLAAVRGEALSSTNTPAGGTRVVLSLADGSRLVGQTSLREVPLQSDAIGLARIAFTNITLVTLGADHKTATVKLRNDDQVHGTVDRLDAVELTTIIGSHSIPWSSIRTLQVASLEDEAEAALPLPQRRVKFLQKHFDVFAARDFQPAQNGQAVIQRLPVQGHTVDFNDMHYCGFKFTVPEWLDGDFEWIYLLIKSEEQKNFFAKKSEWFIIPEHGESEGFQYFRTDSVATYPQLKRQFPFTSNLLIQDLSMDRLQPGKTYAIWFAFQEDNVPDVAFAITIDSERGRKEFGALPLH